ncbi:hypothetical protein B0H66DRAFT_543513 [Apodospora peruviana]|uniref:Uncharacterized protein n=1 Tax=Apodospora peruviana TaxID=516989 RepID=A0AAE0IS75_9PEZI|nr:hypothetical protein B0H66DRAFT_543513 [Apodospora peruviana]
MSAESFSLALSLVPLFRHSIDTLRTGNNWPCWPLRPSKFTHKSSFTSGICQVPRSRTQNGKQGLPGKWETSGQGTGPSFFSLLACRCVGLCASLFYAGKLDEFVLNSLCDRSFWSLTIPASPKYPCAHTLALQESRSVRKTLAHILIGFFVAAASGSLTTTCRL